MVKPVFYHCISRVVDRKLVFGPDEKEKFRTFMRMQENFTGCRVVCLLSDVQPFPPACWRFRRCRRAGFPTRLCWSGCGRFTARRWWRRWPRNWRRRGDGGAAQRVAEIHGRYTYRMHDLSEFMKTLMQRFTQWFNRTHQRTGNLWEDAFKSVIVEDGVAAKTMAAYIDLNPVRAGMVKDPADYRWSSYGEAIGGGPKGNGKKARAGLVRALRAHQGVAADAALWANEVRGNTGRF